MGPSDDGDNPKPIKPWGESADGREIWTGATISLLMVAVRAARPISDAPGGALHTPNAEIHDSARERYRRFTAGTAWQTNKRIESLKAMCQPIPDMERRITYLCLLNQKLEEMAQSNITKQRITDNKSKITQLRAESRELENNRDREIDRSCERDVVFIEHVSALVLFLRRIVVRGRKTMTSNEDAHLQKLTLQIEQLEDDVSVFIRETYYSYILNEFPEIGDQVLSSVPHRCTEQFYEVGDDGSYHGSLDGAMGSLQIDPKKCKRCGIRSDEGRTLKCSKCKVARYCSKQCQKDDWGDHKAECKLCSRGSRGSVPSDPRLPPGSVGTTESDTRLFQSLLNIIDSANRLALTGFMRMEARTFDSLVEEHNLILRDMYGAESPNHLRGYTEMIDSVRAIRGFDDILRQTATGRYDFYGAWEGGPAARD